MFLGFMQCGQANRDLDDFTLWHDVLLVVTRRTLLDALELQQSSNGMLRHRIYCYGTVLLERIATAPYCYRQWIV